MQIIILIKITISLIVANYEAQHNYTNIYSISKYIVYITIRKKGCRWNQLLTHNNF